MSSTERDPPPNYSVEDLERVVTDMKNSNYSYREAQERVLSLPFAPHASSEAGSARFRGEIEPHCSELETLGHVLGQCPKGELLINARHHRVRHALALSLKTLNWEIHEEVHCISSDGSFRRADIIAINGRLKRALVLDPTIRFERNLNQATEVDIEKKSIYEPCLPYLSQKYNVPLKQWSVIGLLFGSRGKVCLVYIHKSECESDLKREDPKIWLLDRSFEWHYLAADFTQYFRMMLVHQGLPPVAVQIHAHGPNTVG
ncbi:hypothetical protein ANN_16596 [Periplaneta americana]|uniref:Uncharacterized protein n=1 Tax=Periplaneta americana TaxID=6978 RepID=A0ABQ8SRM0_PERAM|nr:hypothetical protein ANN_16596 [Periplaneta americana]